jgi:exonuclease VII large subunit
VPDRAEVNRTIENYSRVLDSQFERYRREAVQKMHYYVLASSRFIAQPRQRIEAAQLELKRAVLAVGRRVERLAELARLAESRLRQAQEARIRRQRLELDGAIRGLSGFSPTATLKRGYAIVRHEKRVVRVPNQVKAGDRLVIQLAGGNLGATTNESTKPE